MTNTQAVLSGVGLALGGLLTFGLFATSFDHPGNGSFAVAGSILVAAFLISRALRERRA